MSDEVMVGDFVSFNHQVYGYGEGVVISSRTEYPSGRQIFEVEVDPGTTRSVWYPTVRRIRRVSYSLPPAKRTTTTTVERRVYW